MARIAGSSVSRPLPRSGHLCKRMLRARQLYLLLLIPVVYVFLFNYVPMYGVTIAFKKYSMRQGILGSPWIGLYNFERFLTSPAAVRIVKNTAILSFYSLIAGFPMPIVLALGLNYMPSFRYKRVVQMSTFLPYFLSTVLLVGLMAQILSPQFGIVNRVIKAAGASEVNFMGDASLFRHVYVWSGIWQGMGYGSVVYVAALSSVDPQMHEAAIIDGASILKRIRYIDIPTILPTVVIMLILSMGGILSTGFEKVYLMQNAQNITISETIDTYVYRVSLLSSRPDYSFGTAIGLFQNVVGVAMTLTMNFLSKRLTGSGLM